MKNLIIKIILIIIINIFIVCGIIYLVKKLYTVSIQLRLDAIPKLTYCSIYFSYMPPLNKIYG